MNKSDWYCPFCEVGVKDIEVFKTHERDSQPDKQAFRVKCAFCLGIFAIVVETEPMSKEDVEAKWQGLKPPKKKPQPWGGSKKKEKKK